MGVVISETVPEREENWKWLAREVIWDGSVIPVLQIDVCFTSSERRTKARSTVVPPSTSGGKIGNREGGEGPPRRTSYELILCGTAWIAKSVHRHANHGCFDSPAGARRER